MRLSCSALAMASAPSAFADPPGITRDVTFPPLYPDYGAMGIHHDGAAHHK